MNYYSVLAVTPTNEDWIPAYLEAVVGLVSKHGGQFLARTPNHEQLEGEKQDAALRIIIEWPSKQAALDFSNDADYLPHLKARLAGSVSQHFLIEGKDQLA